MNRNRISIVVMLLSLSVQTGCSSLSLKKPDVWPFNIEDNKAGSPNQIVANWSDTILYQPNQVPVRGFGGRLLFYAEGKKDPVKVEGTLVVYAFDEKHRDAANEKPDRKFIITKEQLASHYSKSKLGHSYSVWLPWDDAGGDQKEISLIVRFMPESGSVLVGAQSRHVLPGKTEMEAGNSNPPVTVPMNGAFQPVSYNAPLSPENQGNTNGMPNGGRRGMITTTIPVPASSILKSPLLMNGGAASGTSYPQTMPLPSAQNPYGQMPNPPTSAAMIPPPNGFANPTGNYYYGAAANPSASAGMNPGMNSPTNTGNPPITSSLPVNPAFQPSIRSGLRPLQAPVEPFAQSTPSHAPWQPHPLGPTFAPGATPPTATTGGLPAIPVTAGSAMY